VSKSYNKKSDLPRNPRDFNKEDRRIVRDKLKHGDYEDLPEFKNRRLHNKDVRE
jgi:hypothetical protein